MPIRKRNFSTVTEIDPAGNMQQVAPIYLHDNRKAVLKYLPENMQRQASRVVWGGYDPSKIHHDDLYIMLRINDDPQNDYTDPEQAIEFKYRHRIKSRGSAIRAFCITCVGGPRAVKMCADIHCPLWSYRMGTNPLSGRSRKG